MGDSYREILIEKKTPVSHQILKVLLIALTVLSFIGGMLILPVMIAAVVFGIISFLVIPKLQVEYEYLYVNGELDIDVIYSRQKRKKMGTYDMKELELLAPSASHALDSWKNKNDIKRKDFTSGDPQAKVYTLVFNREKMQEMIQVELEDDIIADIRRIAPRQVSLN